MMDHLALKNKNSARLFVKVSHLKKNQNSTLVTIFCFDGPLHLNEELKSGSVMDVGAWPCFDRLFEVWDRSMLYVLSFTLKP